MNKRYRDLIAELESIGYVYARTNCKGVDFYLHEDTGCEVKVPGGVNEQTARGVLRDAFRQIGLPTKDNKRNPAQIRERNAAEHARAKAELDRIATERERLVISRRSESELRAIEDAYLRAERKFRYWDRLMRGVA